jgi:hypothetical protein
MQPDENPRIAHHAAPSHREHDLEPNLLHVCADCSGGLVYPLDWIEEEDTGRWLMILRCPDCEAIREGAFSQQAVDLFADELDRGEAELLHALKRVTRENMAEAVGFFIRALDADLILPSDF